MSPDLEGIGNRAGGVMNRPQVNWLIYSTLVLGLGSLFLFYLFLFLGPFVPLNFGLETGPAMVWDACLSLFFFLQHSIMIRRWFKDMLKKFMPAEYISVVFGLASSLPLIALILFWQKTPEVIASARGIFYWLLRGLFFAGIGGFYWGVRSLGGFDPLGVNALRRLGENQEPKTLSLKISGPYRWVRHPLYLFSLLLIWSYPTLTLDRLLFNLLWSVWIAVGTLLEERDLVHDFGDDYRTYQKKVPMLIPYKFPLPAD
jgi:methanethiol S-methyltransferase